MANGQLLGNNSLQAIMMLVVLNINLKIYVDSYLLLNFFPKTRLINICIAILITPE